MTLAFKEKEARWQWWDKVLKAMHIQRMAKRSLAKELGVTAPFLSNVGVFVFPSQKHRQKIVELLGVEPYHLDV